MCFEIGFNKRGYTILPIDIEKITFFEKKPQLTVSTTSDLKLVKAGYIEP